MPNNSHPETSNLQNIPQLLSGTAALIENIRATLNSETSLSTKSLLLRAKLYLGASISEGRYDFRYLYDALEVALHQIIEDRAATLRVLEPANAIDHLEKLIGLLPNQRIRTSEQSLFQQFSSPAPLAFVATHVAVPEENAAAKILLEPSAGTGALACIARAFGSQVYTNDLSPTRRGFLHYLNFPVHGVDAENINDLLPQELRPDIVLMNPPFSATAGRLSRNDNQHGAQHIETALYRLNQSGRLVAITGCGMALDRQKMTEFWKRVASRYSVRVNLSLPASTFTKSGTAWETQLIVIDKTGPTVGANWTEQVKNIRHGSATLLEILTLARENKLLPNPSASQVPSPAPQTTSDQTPILVASETHELTDAAEAVTNDQIESDASDDGFVPYISTRLTGGVDHPAPLVETAAMAAVVPPPITYRPHLDPQLVIDGALSTVQLERICYAGQRHSQRLPTGARAAYLLGDGTGFGKGRCLAGVIIDNHSQGRARTLWLSISNQLLESTRRDLNDLNASHIALHQLNEWDVNETINFGDGVIFCSYNTLIAKSKISEKTRMQQLIEWLGDEGVVIFDECQRAQHALASAQGEATQTGKAVLELQDHDQRPDLRFVYSSATSVVEVSHICYMSRLGLWGPETAFPAGFEEFMSEIDAGGLGALEMVTRSMKAFGMSHSSTLSYGRDPVSGLAVEYAEVFYELTAEQREIYNNAAAAWQVVLQNIEAALAITDAGTRKRAFALSHFWAQHQAFFRQVITAFKVPECIKQIEAALKRDESAVVSIIGTAEAKSKVMVARAAAQGEQLADLDFSPRATLCALVERAFPVDLYQQVEDPVSHSIVTVRVTDEEGKPVQSQEALRMRAELLEKLSDLVLPENPLDQVVNYFGPDQVAEISGRRKRLIRDPRNGEVRYVSRAPKGVPMNKINIYENEQFQNGAKRIAIITAAGSTGISLHSSLNAINQQRRCQIVLELAWSAVLQMQSFGRTHRSFQKYPPKYILLSTNLGGERRFSATIARRLASLGALCKGDRKAADGGTQLSRYTFESPLGRGTLDLLYRRIFEGKEIPDLDDPREALEDMGLLNQDGEINERDRYHIPRFLNRLLSLDCDRQNALFAYYSDLFDQCVAHAKASGTFDEGVQDIKALSIKLASEPEVVYIDETTKAETLHYTLAVETRSTRVSADRAASMLEGSNGGAFYRQSKGNIILATKSGNHTDHQSGQTYQTYAVTKPEEGRAYYITDAELRKYKKVPAKSALAWWKLYCENVPETTTKELHLIAGAVLPLWQRLKTTQDAQLKVVRVVTEDNQRIVGVKIPTNRVQQVLRALGIACAISDPADIIHAVLKTDDQIALVEGLSLSRSRIYGESYVEIRGATHHKFGELREMGLLNMRIDYRERFLLPTDTDEAIELLHMLLKRYPIVTPVNEAPQEMALPTTELRALAQTETIDIFDLLDAPRPAVRPTISLPASKPVEEAYIPTIYNSGFPPAQLTFWGALDQAA
jgi:protein strawberry notch